MQKVIVQIPMTRDLKEKAEIASSDLGFSSLQETIRVLLTKLSKRELSIRVEESTEEIILLSKTAERKFRKAKADVKAGKNITKTESIEELLNMLNV